MDDKVTGMSADCGWVEAACCRARRLGASNLVECQTGVGACRWRIPFGEGQLCAHHANQVIAGGAVLRGWLMDASGMA